MSACLYPDVEMILRAAISTIEEVLTPELQSDWARYSAALLAGSLQYALDRCTSGVAERHASELGAALASLQARSPEIAALASPADAIEQRAGSLLSYAQRNPGPLSDTIQQALRPLLLAQLAEDLTESRPLLAAFARNPGRDA